MKVKAGNCMFGFVEFSIFRVLFYFFINYFIDKEIEGWRG